MNKSLLIRFIMTGFLSVVALCVVAMPQTINADLKNLKVNLSPATLVHNGHLTICKIDAASYEVVKTMQMVVTAYSSTPDQTDDTPFITASGKHVAEGIIATNILPFGTKVRINGKMYTVEDRMNARYNGKKRADIWFASRSQAKNFGAQIHTVEIIES